MDESPRRMSGVDRFICQFDRVLRSRTSTELTGGAEGSETYPAGKTGASDSLSDRERRHAAGLMRVDHAGEVAAQALYQGQAATARSDTVRRTLRAAAIEETEHLGWCRERLRELDDAPSRFDPLWYAGAFVIGAVAGLAGDRWNLGFVAETERQVVEHLDRHLLDLPENDSRSRAIIERMRDDEREHATRALDAGAAELPAPVKRAMRLAARVMTGSAYWA